MQGHLKVDFENCTGCGACVRACPVQAITWKSEGKGFPYPVIDAEKCIECGKCVRVCQLHAPKPDHNVLAAFALQLKDRDILADSSSGGAFSAFAGAILEKGGVVYGCVFDALCKAVYARAELQAELVPMRGSKYVWADASASYGAVRTDLDAGRAVLFCALPCQVTGLRLFLGREYPNLFAMDFLCAGPPPPSVFDAYVASFSKESERGTLAFKFRDKSLHGAGYCISYCKNGKKKYVTQARSSYMYLFAHKLVQRTSCYHCPFRGVHRVADLTIGDYWGAKQFLPDWDCRAGVSFAIVNSPKGLDLFREGARLCRVQPTRVEDIAQCNIVRPDDSVKRIPIPAKRELFFAMFKTRGYKMAARRCSWTVKRLKSIVLEIIGKTKGRS